MTLSDGSAEWSELFDSDAWVGFRAWYELAGRAIRYHIAARFIFKEAPDITVAGYLAHASVEFAMKSVLAAHTTEASRRIVFGHKLPELWAEVGAHTDGERPDFDAVVRAVDSLWTIRYPETTARTGMIGFASLSPGDHTVLVNDQAPREPIYSLVVDEVDALMDHLLLATRVNPATIRPSISDVAWGYLSSDNKSLRFWSQ